MTSFPIKHRDLIILGKTAIIARAALDYVQQKHSKLSQMIQNMKISKFKIVFVYLLAAIQLSSCADETSEKVLSRVGFFSLPDIAEPSGICIGADPEVLYIVSDDGTIAAVSTEGEVIYSSHFPSMDFEGVTFNHQTGNLLVLEERKSVIFSIEPTTLEILDSWKIPGKTKGSYEGITWKSDDSIFLVNQVRNHADKNAEILRIRDIDGEPVLERRKTGIEDQSGICVDPSGEFFYLISDSDNTLYKIDQDGNVREKLILPGESQEGISVDGRGTIYIAQDRGGVMVLSVNE